MEAIFSTGWRRFVPYIGYHHVLMMLLTVTIVAWGLLLAGCASGAGAMPNIYFLSVSYVTPPASVDTGSDPSFFQMLVNLTQDTRIEVRGAFFQTCVKVPTAIQSRAYWDCGSTDELLTRYGADVDPLGLIDYVHDFVSRIIFYGLIIGSMILTIGAILLLSTFPGWHTSIGDDGSEVEVKPFPSRPVSQVVMWSLAWSFALGFVSILWIHVGTVASAESVQTNFRHVVTAGIGPVAMTLGWLAVALTAIGFCGMLVMIMSIQLLDRLTDED